MSTDYKRRKCHVLDKKKTETHNPHQDVKQPELAETESKIPEAQ